MRMTGMADVKRNLHVGVLFYILSLVIPVITWWMTGAECGSLGGRKVVVQIFRLICDASLILIPYWWLPRRYRWLTFIPLFIIPLWCVGGVMYFRFWGDVPGLTSLGLIGNVNGELLRSAGGLWRWSDVLLLLMPVALLIVCTFGWWRKITTSVFTKRLRIGATISSVVLFLVSQCVSSWSMYRHSRANGFDETIFSVTRQRYTDPIFTQIHDLAVNGRVVHFIRSLPVVWRMMNLHINLTAEQRAEIDREIAGSRFPSFEGDSVLESNRNKNLVLILVESLNSYVIDMDLEDQAGGDKRAVAPVMRSLLNSEGTVSALNLETQVRTGGSGDGQLITNTGLLPLSDFSTAIALGSTVTFPSLCRAFEERENIVIFGDDAATWNERSTFADGYGFRRLLTNRDYSAKAESMGGDAALFTVADSMAGTLRQPFFMELLTVSMHVPFIDDRILDSLRARWIEDNRRLPEVERNYLAMVNYFDSALGIFIDGLKRRGIYDDTVIVIVSDHAQELAVSGEVSIDDVPMAFMAVNTGLGTSSASDGSGLRITERAGQIDVYPTILHIMGKSGWNNWKGVGRSLLSPSSSSSALDIPDFGTRAELSERILRSNYFNRGE